LTVFRYDLILRGLCRRVPIQTHADPIGRLDRVQLKRLLQWQIAFALIAVLIALPFGTTALVSAAIGGGVCLLANWVFALRVFRRYRAQQPGELVMRMYGAEVVKVFLILASFSVAFMTLQDLNLPALLGTYFAVQVLPALFASRPDARPNSEK
jgi:ATP synthase protein I